MTRLTEHFDWEDFASDGREYGLPLLPVPSNLRPFTERLARELEVLRHALGDRPMTIISGYRTPAHNAAAKGAKNSQHMQAKAADIAVEGLTDKQMWCTAKALIQRGALAPGGVGWYANGRTTHYDIRGTFKPYGGMDGSIPLPNCTGVTIPPLPAPEQEEDDDMAKLIKAPLGSVYATNGVQKWHVPDEATLKALQDAGVLPHEIKAVSAATADAIPTVGD